MTTPREPTAPTTAAIDQFCSQFDPLFNRRAARDAFRRYPMDLLLPRERNKALTVLAALLPGTARQRLHHVLHHAPWPRAPRPAHRGQRRPERPQAGRDLVHDDQPPAARGDRGAGV
jgi:hypothetical protein